MRLFPGKIEIIINKKKLLSLNKPLKVYEYETKSGNKFTTSKSLKQGYKVIILDSKNYKNNYKCKVENYFLDCEKNFLSNLSKAINQFYQKSVYFDYLNDLKGIIKCYANSSFTEDIYRVEASDIVLPIHGSRNLRNFRDREKDIFPVCRVISGQKRKKHQITDKGVFYVLEEYKFPIEYDGSIELFMFGKKFKEFKIKLYCYGFIDIEKWHLVVLSHYLKNVDGFNFSLMPKLCREMMRKKKEENISNCEIDKCIKEKAFPEGHKILMPYLKKYLKKAVTFFENPKTIKDVYIKKINPAKLGDNVVELTIFTHDLNNLLVIYGISYNWNTNEIPIVHCNFVTFYSGSVGQTPDKVDYEGKLKLEV